MSVNLAARHYLIIGSGVAGIAAAQSIRESDPSAEIGMVSDDPSGYYSRPGLAHLLTGELREEQLFPLSLKDFKELNMRLFKARAHRIFPAEHRVALDDRLTLFYDRLLLATGSRSIPLDVPGAELPGVIKLDSLEDARQILECAKHARTAVVVGGGSTAIELVEGLRARGLHVYYFLRGDRFWNNVLDETESRIVEYRLSRLGVQLHHHTEPEMFISIKNKLTGVRTKDGHELRCELAAYSIGVRPRVELALTAGLRVDRGIQVDDLLQTSDADIFAAGDVAQVFDPYSGQTVLDTLWPIARDEGRAAGHNMAGATTHYRKNVPLNVTRLAGLTTTIIGTVWNGSDPDLTGIARGDSETWRQLSEHTVVETRTGTNRLRLLIGEQRLLGAVVMNDQTLSRPLEALVKEQVDISSIRQSLLEAGNLPEIITSFWAKWKSGLAGPQP